MKKYIAVLSVLIATSHFATSQNKYFYNQKNFISLRLNFNPRIVAMTNNGKKPSEDGTAYGTYYQEYNKNGILTKRKQNMNLMLNFNYGRLFAERYLVGFEINYQKHHLTMKKNGLYLPKKDPNIIDFYDSDYPTPFSASSPIFNTFDFMLSIGRFSSKSLSPNKHLFQLAAGVRAFFLDKKQAYYYDANTPITDLSRFMEGYDKPFIVSRISLIYTYRILITKGLSFDIGASVNANISANFTPKDGAPTGYKAFNSGSNQPIYDRLFVKTRLGYESFLNIFYFRTGFSYAL